MTINVNNGTTINNAIGERDHWGCKPVINLSTGDVYASATDAANALGCTIYAVSTCCLGKVKTCKGNKLAYVKHASENVDDLAASLRTMREKMEQLEADAAVGRAIREEQEAKRKAEEAHKNAIAQAEEAIAKAKEMVERRQRIAERKNEELKLAQSRLAEANRELYDAEYALHQLKGDNVA